VQLVDGDVCSACGSAQPYVYRFTVNGCPIRQCPECGLGQADPNGFDPGRYYTADYFNGQHSDGYADYLGAEPVLRKEFARTVAFIRKFVPCGRLLDIGCAYGFFLQEAKRYYDVAGIELAADAAEHCRRHGLNVVTGVADASTMARLGTFDVITLFDVIEHLPEPDEVLAHAARHLRPGGVLVVTTGDFASMAARVMGPKWRLMTPPQHLCFFTRESIRAMGESVGLSLIDFAHPAKIVPLSLIAFQLRRMLGLRPAPAAHASKIGMPVNLFDAMRVMLQKSAR
jgi:2-polyprenyl-3-methyl-5-hydroxy-6-metoxy-1,4-benzoquinol methylase